jgi:hypothetical protein
MGSKNHIIYLILCREFAEKRLLAFFRTQQNTKQKFGAIYRRKSSQKAQMIVTESQNSRKRHTLMKANRVSTPQGIINSKPLLHIFCTKLILKHN